MAVFRDSAVYTGDEAITLAKKIERLNNDGCKYQFNYCKGIDGEDVILLLWEMEIEDEAVEGEPLD